MSDVVIRVENLSKQYHLGTISHGTLYQDLQSTWARFRGREDPNLQIDPDGHIHNGQTDDVFLALNNISFDVNEGEIVGIIGRNGAGKSTLLKILSRVTAPTSGVIRIKGRVASLLEVGTGFHPELTGRENIFLNGAILGMQKMEIEQKFDEIVKFSEIEKFIDTPVKRYSSGMYVRLAFSVAAHLEPEILLVDEVLAVGDASFQKKCLGKMGDVAKQGRTILFVSHNMAAIQRLCTSAILIEHGKISQNGDVGIVTSAYLEKNNESLVQWQRTEIARSDAFFTRIFLSDERGKLVSNVTTRSQLFLKIEFCIKKKIENLQLAITFNSSHCGTIFASTPEDTDVLTPKHQGNYQATITLPTHLFLPVSYEITCSLYSPGGRGYDHVENLVFSVENTDCWSNRIYGGRSGALAVPCPWKIVLLEK